MILSTILTLCTCFENGGGGGGVGVVLLSMVASGYFAMLLQYVDLSP